MSLSTSSTQSPSGRADVSMESAGDCGASNGAEMPVNSLISPRRAEEKSRAQERIFSFRN